MIQINNGNGRVSAWGMASDVKSIKWVRAPDLLPQAFSYLDLTGAAIYGVFEDGTEQELTVHCGFQPSQHTYIPDEKFITVTAYYVSKSGKTHSADISLPVCYPAELRLVVTGNVIDENYYDSESPDFDPDTLPLDKWAFKPYCVWKRINPMTEQEVTVRIAPVPDENMHYTYNVDRDGSDVSRTYDYWGHYWWVISSIEKPLEDVEVWHNPYNSTVESFERPIVVSAYASIGVDYLYATTYVETQPIKLSYADLPTELEISPDTGIPIAHFTKDNIRFAWGNTDPVAPTAGLNDMWIYVGGSTDYSAAQSEMDVAWHDDGDEHDVYALRRNPAYWYYSPQLSDEPYEYTHYIGKRNGNSLEWTLIEE